MSRVLLIMIMAMGCSEYNIGKASDAEDGSEEGAEEEEEDITSPDPTDTGTPPVPDSGLPPIDTGEPFDPPDDEPVLDSCPPLETTDTVEIDDSCVADPETGPLGAWLEWEMSSFDAYPTYDEMVTTPIVGQITDDNGDGVIDSNDIPDIVATFDDNDGADDKFGVIRRISGDGRDDEVLVVKWTEDGDDWGPYRYATVALGDIDNDGEPDIVTVLGGPPAIPGGPPPDGPGIEIEGPEDHPIGPPPPPSGGMEPDISCYPAAFTADGVLKWVYKGSFIDCGGHAIALADLEGDGTVEVILGKVIVNGEDGTLQGEGWKGDASYGGAYFEMGQIPSIADMDGDGDQEVLAGNTIYNADGSEVCSLMEPSKDGFTAVADLDMDGDGEIVMVWDHKISILSHECHELREWPMVGDGTGGPPTIADFDGDGMPEIGVASARDYVVYEWDGSALLWGFGTTDASSHATGSTVFDFEGDGRPEVVYGDEVSLWVLDGMTGEVRLEDTRHSSRTLHEYPIVVDVDGDGYPEIVVPNGGGHYGDANTGLYVLGSDTPRGDGWLGGRQVWNQHAYNIVNVNDDLSIPAHPESNWPYHNNFRSGDVNPVYGDNAPDAVPVVDSCPWDCDDGVLRLQIRLANQGTATLRHDMKLTVYDAATDDPIVIESISPPIEPGFASEPFEYAFSADTIGPDGLYVAVDDAEGVETVRECDEDNNMVWLPEATCL
jgi:hypothetical protein